MDSTQASQIIKIQELRGQSIATGKRKENVRDTRNMMDTKLRPLRLFTKIQEPRGQQPAKNTGKQIKPGLCLAVTILYLENNRVRW